MANLTTSQELLSGIAQKNQTKAGYDKYRPVSAESENVFHTIGDNKFTLKNILDNYLNMVQTVPFIYRGDTAPRNPDHIGIWLDTSVSQYGSDNWSEPK